MKLHRIALQNLNSLYDEHAVDLDDDLDGAALFLIQGPTGAGKSTLMDAVSLALFGTTPRLSRAGHDRATTGEAVAEQIMSRGTGEATAQVEFSTWREGRRVRFRATWTAWRANKRPDGNLQKPARSLDRRTEDGEWAIVVSSQKQKDYDPAFTDALDGFGPEDFQRSMLLAQGNFDAMLRASPTERATILERLTDTSEYAAIGRRASEVNKAWTRRLSEVQARRAAISPTRPEELAEARAVQEQSRAALGALQQRTELTSRGIEWLQQGTALARRAAAAAEAVEAAKKDHERHDEELAALAEHERCAEALVARTEQQRLAAEADRTAAQVTATQQRLPEREAALAQAVQARDALQRRLTAQEQALAGLREPAQQSARAKDAVRRTHSEQLSAQARRARAARRRDEAAAAAQRAQVALEAAATAASQAAAALEARASDARLYAEKDALLDVCGSLRERVERLGESRARLRTDRTALDQRQAQLAERRTTQQAREHARLAPPTAALASAQTAESRLADGEPPEAALAAARERREALLVRHEQLKEAVEAARRADEARTELTAAQDAAGVAQTAHEAATTALAQAQARSTSAAETLRRAEEVLAPLQRIAALSAERAELSPDETCPLCGSVDHPFHSDPAVQASFAQVGAELQAAQDARARAQDQRKSCEAAHRAAQVAVATASARTEAAARRLTEARQRSESREQSLQTALARVDLALPPDAARAPAAAAALDACRERGAAARDRITALEAAAKARAVAEETLRTTREALQAEARELDQETTRLGERQTELVRRAQQLDQDAASLTTARQALLVRLTDLDVAAPADAPETAAATVRARASAWSAVQADHKTAQANHESAQQTTTAAHSTLAQASADLTEAAEAATAREQSHAAARQAAEAAATVLSAAWVRCQESGLVPPALDLPEAPLRTAEEALAQQRTALESQRTTAATAGTALTETRARLQTLSAAHARLQADLAAAATHVEALRQSLGLASLDALDAARLDDAALKRLRTLLRSLQERRTTARATQAAVAEQLAAHASARPTGLEPDATVEALTARRAALAEERNQLQERLDTAGATLRIAAEKADELRKIDQELEQSREQAAVWLHLHELIGRADGRHFKEFAQALNLDQLLARANQHLARLSPRYRLQTLRDPDSGLPTLDFCIRDQWRPGTTRPVRTLSGGESFLVSLAMALGLSDLRTSRMPVETLLLDEGFGTLDPQTLDVALAALQQLQSSGRQVGIISHVVGLQESIPARILVEPVGDGRSRVRACTG